MARKDALSNILPEFMVTIVTQFGSTNVKVRHATEELATALVADAFTTEYPSVDFTIGKVRKVEPRQATETSEE